MSGSRRFIGSVIVLYFIIGLEVLVMISPFAAFFYAAFNPFLLFLANWPATHWLADFFLPHMVLPPDAFLRALRVAGSVLFVSGTVLFLVCAAQVYSHKFLRRGPVLGGAYRWIRHPQYAALAVAGLGLAILWPRFLTVVLWAVMMGLYSFLARDEERRMVAAFGEQYSAYISRTGMFLPRPLEQVARKIPAPRTPVLRGSLGLTSLLVLSIGTAFALRSYTVARLPIWSDGRVSVLAILPGDAVMVQHRMPDVLRIPEIGSRLAEERGAILGYIVPPNYVMQGMIADTDPAFRLYEHNQTIAMIADWIFHPFRHLEGGHEMVHHTPGEAAATSPTARRIIFLRVGHHGDLSRRASLFAIDQERVPQFFVDLDMHSLTVLNLKDLGPGTGWGNVPTPMF